MAKAGKVIMNLASGQNIGKEIADALGLKHCTSLDIHIHKDKFVTATATFNPEIEGMKQIYTILKKFHLTEIDGRPVSTCDNHIVSCQEGSC